nr:hypothetical protein [Planctomicrobium sp.]
MTASLQPRGNSIFTCLEHSFQTTSYGKVTEFGKSLQDETF